MHELPFEAGSFDASPDSSKRRTTAPSTKRAPERGSASDIAQTPPDLRAEIREQGAAAVTRTALAEFAV